MLFESFIKSTLVTMLLLLIFSQACFAGEDIVTDKESFAQEYASLKLLLQKVKSKEQAILYKPQIEQEIARLKSSQRGSGEEFSALTDEEKKIFIEKFQNNRYHCGEVTQVMEEQRRILLNPALKEILGSLVQNIP